MYILRGRIRISIVNMANISYGREIMETKLMDLVQEINGGQIMSRVSYKDDEEKDPGALKARVLVPSAISGGVVHHGNLGTADLKKEVSEKRITKCGDIVIKLSSPYDCGLITEEDENLIIPSFCAIIRRIDQSRVYDKYLLGFMNSHYSMTKLLAGVNTTAMAMVRTASLQALPVLLLPMEEQIVIGDAYWESCKRKRLLEQMVNKQQEISDAIIQEALREASKNA